MKLSSEVHTELSRPFDDLGEALFFENLSKAASAQNKGAPGVHLTLKNCTCSVTNQLSVPWASPMQMN